MNDRPHQKPTDDSGAVAVTGIGMVAPGAASSAELWANIEAGRSPAGVSSLSSLYAVCRVIEPLDATLLKKIRRGHRADRVVHLAALAASRAWSQAGLGHGMSEANVAVVVGCSRGPVGKWEEATAATIAGRRMPPSLAAESTMACLHGSLAALLGARGSAYTVSTACASGGHAVALGADHIVSGTADIAVVGGADASLTRVMLQQFAAAGILDSQLPPEPVCRPYDRSGAGTVLGEGAAFLILEKVSHARARGAKIFGILSGWGLAADGGVTSAESAGAEALSRAASAAVEKAGLRWSDVGYINTHGTGTRVNDDMEMAWLRRVSGASGGAIPYSSTKAVTGHCLGATPVIEAAVCLEALRRRSLARSVHCRTPHPGAPEGLVLEAGLSMEKPAALSTSVGFWGAACALLFTAAPGEESHG